MGRILKIREVGDPFLNSNCKKVDVKNLTQNILEEIEDMKETLFFTEGFGIAAPQVGINKRIAIIKVDKEKCTYNDAEDVPTTVMINPSWKPLSDESDIQFEGCLSVPNLRGKVERFKEIEVSYYNEKGEKIVKKVKGFTARDIQHECDHLDGITFLEKVVGPNGFATKEMMKKFELNKM